jgi:hypothetical protein
VGDQLIATPGDEVISGDGTAVRLADRVVVLDARDAVVCDTLVFVTSTLDLPALERLARDAVGGTLVAPFDSDQQKVLERLGVATLPHSRQVTVDAGSVELVGRPS